MANAPRHIAWLRDTGERRATRCGRAVEIWALTPNGDTDVLAAWARHFRQQYCTDQDLSAMLRGTEWEGNAAGYCRSVLFPDRREAPGPSVRSGDFSEILLADYIEYVLGYWCPRDRYKGRFNRNDSTKGCDVVGFRFASDRPHHPDDELIVVEAKAGMTGTMANRLQDAVEDSTKDAVREAMTLNALKQRLYGRGAEAEAARITRFQNETARPFRRISGAAAVLDDDVFGATDFAAVDTTGHKNAGRLRLLVFRGPSLMELVHALYERAADEA